MDDEIALEVDALGLLCPLPVLRLRKRMQAVASGAIVRLLADDPAAHVDVPHFCAEAGHAFLGADRTAFLVRKGSGGWKKEAGHEGPAQSNREVGKQPFP